MKPRDEQKDLKKLAIAFFENLRIDNCEYGAIGVDPKRPFGNSYVNGDILEIIGVKPPNENGYTEKQEDYAQNLYHSKLIPWLQENCQKAIKESLKK